MKAWHIAIAVIVVFLLWYYVDPYNHGQHTFDQWIGKAPSNG